jgi:microcystin-dependent protein
VSDQFVAEIRILACNFAPKYWAFCDGQILPISMNTALFSLLGTYYGGDGKSNFALPDLRDRVPIGNGSSPFSTYFVGNNGGVETVPLLPSEMPIHNHQIQASASSGDYPAPRSDTALAVNPGANQFQNTVSSGLAAMDPNSLAQAGGDLPHNNMMPYLTLTFCIALQGVFPSY